ncbi:MAG: hypothetical protein JSU72_10870 [Deltaproteobacteria bacterium]|nr:MAG: hypothetical protein JSU72_10870 [Deltaproteobacteria bacterium]
MELICLQCKNPYANDDLDLLSSGEEWMHFFCSVTCKNDFVYPELTNRVCAREECNQRVPEGQRMLCLMCFHRGDNLKEPGMWFDVEDNVQWERGKQGVIRRLEEQVLVYSSEDMTQEELRALVPSLQMKVA